MAQPKTKRLQPIQAKLTIGEPGDKYEQEADAVASQVMSISTLQPEMVTSETQKQVRSQPLAAGITPLVQHKAMPQSDHRTQETGDLESRLNKAKGGGSPLPEKVKTFMEPRFNANLSDVRVHTGSEAVQMNREIGAEAFTSGNDIFYGKGNSPDNDHLTAHELAH
ncbi:MAG: DUF4157 domain-containing protein, partial [Nostoc sp.]|uniref:eCIS core domain-containing protein n=1 Tax=Nostoc sp. TaxID=1180 RepID=UPI002FFA385E